MHAALPAAPTAQLLDPAAACTRFSYTKVSYALARRSTSEPNRMGAPTFFGTEVAPGKTVPFVPPPEQTKLHLSQARHQAMAILLGAVQAARPAGPSCRCIL